MRYAALTALLALWLGHGYHMLCMKFDYGRNMVLCVALGAMQSCGWVAWALAASHPGKCALHQATVIRCMRRQQRCLALHAAGRELHMGYLQSCVCQRNHKANVVLSSSAGAAATSSPLGSWLLLTAYNRAVRRSGMSVRCAASSLNLLCRA